MSEKNEVTRVNSEREKDFSFEYPQKPMTNGDKIRAMSDSEYADWLCDHLICGDCPLYKKCREEERICDGLSPVEDCFNRLLGWLRSPVGESPSGE